MTNLKVQHKQAAYLLLHLIIRISIQNKKLNPRHQNNLKILRAAVVKHFQTNKICTYSSNNNKWNNNNNNLLIIKVWWHKWLPNNSKFIRPKWFQCNNSNNSTKLPCILNNNNNSPNNRKHIKRNQVALKVPRRTIKSKMRVACRQHR
jgi:hypothetical protein